MITATAQIILYAPSCHSLKDKRAILKRIIERLKNKFNISIAEVDKQDVIQTIVLGVAIVSNSASHGRQVLDEVIRFIDANAEAEITNIEFE